MIVFSGRTWPLPQRLLLQGPGFFSDGGGASIDPWPDSSGTFRSCQKVSRFWRPENRETFAYPKK
jgi:hypothetical protein